MIILTGGTSTQLSTNISGKKSSLYRIFTAAFQAINHQLIRVFCASIISLLSFTEMNCQALYAFKGANGLYGFKDKKEKVVIEALYTSVNEELFQEPLMGVYSKERGSAYINKAGQPVIPFGKYSDLGKFSDGRGSVSKGKKTGYVDSTGNLVIPIKFFRAGNFSEGLAAAADKSKNMGYIDRSGNWVISPRFFIALPMISNRAPVLDKLPGGSWAVIDRRGNFITSHKFNFLTLFSEGLAAFNEGGTFSNMSVRPQGGKWGYIDTTGKVVIPARFTAASDFVDDTAIVRIDGEKVEIDRSGAVVKRFGPRAPLKEGDPLAGTWRCEEGAGAGLYAGEPHQILVLKPGSQRSVMGLYIDPEQGLAGPSYFNAVVGSSWIEGMLIESAFPSEVGKSFSFDYRYLPGEDVLVITVDNKSTRYKRMKEKTELTATSVKGQKNLASTDLSLWGIAIGTRAKECEQIISSHAGVESQSRYLGNGDLLINMLDKFRRTNYDLFAVVIAKDTVKELTLFPGLADQLSSFNNLLVSKQLSDENSEVYKEFLVKADKRDTKTYKDGDTLEEITFNRGFFISVNKRKSYNTSTGKLEPVLEVSFTIR